jgi:predicted MFS family arabinose efflux permease
MRLTRDPRYRWVVAGMAFFAVLAAIGFGRFGYSAVLPSMQEDLGISSAAAGSLASWNQVGYTVMALVGGILASRFGARVVVTVGLLVTATGMLFTGFAQGLAMASAARLLTGMGNGMVLAPSLALMVAWFEPARLGAASGIVPAGSSLALVVVGPMVPALLDAGGADGWRLVWYVFAAVTLLVALLTVAVLRDRPYRERHTTLGRLRAVEMRAIVRSGHAWLLGLIYFLYGFAFLLFFTFFQKLLTTDLGYSDETAGTLFLILGATGVASGVLWGRVSDGIGRGRTLAIVLLVEAAVALVFALWHSIAALVVGSAVFGLCGLSVPALLGAACGDKYGARMAAASLGFVTAFVGIGQIIGPYVGGALEDAYGSLVPSYLVAAGVFAAAAAVSLLLRDERPVMHAAHTSSEP